MRLRRVLAPAVVLSAFVAACGGPPSWRAEIEPVEHPDLAAAEKVARRQLEAQRAELARLLERRRTERRDLAASFGATGRLYHAYGLLPAAAACYANARRLDPASFLWPYYLGLLELTDGRPETAAEHLESALGIAPDNAPVRLRLAEARLALNDPAAARAHLEPLASDERYAAAAHSGLGRAAAAAGDPARAVEHFTAVLELQPEAGSVRQALGLALRRLGRDDEADAALAAKGSGEVRFPDPLAERLEELAVSPGSLLRRANRALMEGRLDDAVATYRRAVEADPDYSAARRNFALALVRQGEVDEAVRQLQAALRTAPDDVRVHFDLANGYRVQGAYEAAVEAYGRALELDPEMVAARFNLANLLAETKRWDEAAGHLEKVLELEPRHSRARYLAAMARHHQGRSQEAAARLEALLAEEPENTFARQGLAAVYAALQRPQRAMAVYREAADLDLPAAEKVELLHQLASLAWRSGRRGEAIDAFRRAVELAPASSAAVTKLANALQLTGQRAEAVELFARATELDPGNATAWLSEASLRILAGDYALAVSRLEAALAQVGAHAGLNHTLARLLATCPDPALRDGARALALAQTAQALESSLEHAATVGMALAELGRFEEAVRWQQSLIGQAQGRVPPAAIEQLRAHLRLYESRKAVRIGESG